MASSIVRNAHWSDIPAMATILKAAFFENNDLFGRFMHPHRHEYPEDVETYWLRQIRAAWMLPNQWYVVAVVRKSASETKSGEQAAIAETDHVEEEIVGVAKWMRKGPNAPEPVQIWGTGNQSLFFLSCLLLQTEVPLLPLQP